METLNKLDACVLSKLCTEVEYVIASHLSNIRVHHSDAKFHPIREYPASGMANSIRELRHQSSDPQYPHLCEK